MGKILTLSDQKGGTSKSTSAVHLGAALKIMGKKCLSLTLIHRAMLQHISDMRRNPPILSVR